jgi:hypothetical protein
VRVLEAVAKRKLGNWIWYGFIAVIALQVYYVREMLAALLIFGVLFGFGTAVVLVLFLLDQASQRTAEWAEPQAKRAAEAARRGLAHVEELSKKLPHSQRPA